MNEHHFSTIVFRTYVKQGTSNLVFRGEIRSISSIIRSLFVSNQRSKLAIRLNQRLVAGNEKKNLFSVFFVCRVHGWLLAGSRFVSFANIDPFLFFLFLFPLFTACSTRRNSLISRKYSRFSREEILLAR